MGVQKEILRRTFTGEVQRWEVETDAEGKKTPVLKTAQYKSGTGTLIGGTPGQIYDVAYGPVVHTTTLAEAAEIGSFVEGQGIIINAPEYALYGTLPSVKDGKLTDGPLAPSLLLPTGSVVSCMTAGHVWMTRKAYADMGDKMNAAIIWQEPTATADNDLIVVEVNGMSSYGPNPDSSAQG